MKSVEYIAAVLMGVNMNNTHVSKESFNKLLSNLKEERKYFRMQEERNEFNALERIKLCHLAYLKLGGTINYNVVSRRLIPN